MYSIAYQELGLLVSNIYIRVKSRFFKFEFVNYAGQWMDS